MKKSNWLIVGIISIAIILLLFIGGMIMGGGGMMGPGGMMNNWGYSPAPFGWVGMIFMWLIPIGLTILAVFGVVWLVRKSSNSES